MLLNNYDHQVDDLLKDFKYLILSLLKRDCLNIFQKEEKYMSNTPEEIREGIMEAMGRITSFWGFSKIMGQVYGLLYLSFKPLTLDEMADSLAVSKGNVSINIRTLERWNMVKPVWVKGDRKDYYEAETDFWKIVKGVLREREKKEFDQALSTVSNYRKKVEDIHKHRRNLRQRSS